MNKNNGFMKDMKKQVTGSQKITSLKYDSTIKEESI